jgi:hypothetical protein
MLAHGFAVRLERYSVAVMHEPIEDCVGQRRLTEIRVPGVDWQLTDEDGRARRDATVEDLEKVGPVLGAERRQSPSWSTRIAAFSIRFSNRM